jgi:exopolysaccharide biosynthesis polyprenyl glycosylphosphotransferase
MLKEKDAVLRKIMMAVDLLAISTAFVLSYGFRVHIHSFYKLDLFPFKNIISNVPWKFSEQFMILMIVAPLWGFLLHHNGAYRSWRLKATGQIIWVVFKASALTILFVGSFFFLFKITFVSRIFFMAFGAFGFIGLVGEKIVIMSILHAIRKRGYNYRQIMIIGTGRRAENFIKKIKGHPEWGLRVIGAIEDEAGRGVERVDGVQVIGDLSAIPDILHQAAIDEVVIVVPRLRLDHLGKAIRDCEIEGVKVTIAVDLFDMNIAKAEQSELDGIPLLSFKTTVLSEWQLLAKRAMDVTISGFMILGLSPLLFLIALLIKMTSPGPAFFKQERVGLNKRRFIILKFRTMVMAAQKDLSKVDIYEEIYGPQWKTRKINYVTPIGKILRKFSLDELPQLFNVFLGHMSLVGPRPTLPQEVEQYQTWFRRRFSMRPGVTCLWQVSGRRDVQLKTWMQMDLHYLDHWSLWLDIKILLRTIPAVLFGHGAY